jgi:hypothetical protein
MPAFQQVLLILAGQIGQIKEFGIGDGCPFGSGIPA